MASNEPLESGGAPPGSGFTIKEEPIENHRAMTVRVIGAGYSGVYLGIRIPQRLRNIDLAIYEKNAGIGGTWWENRYPGCACDIPAHSYQYSFAPKTDWSSFYAPAKELCDYINDVADKYGAKRFIKTQHQVMSCTWDERLKKWHLVVKRTETGETFEEHADVVVSARGLLNNAAWPQIAGLDSFRGEKMHSAKWNQDYDFRNKRIGLIGGGSSAIQIAPELQKVEGGHLSVFVRSKVWISNRFGDYVMTQLGLDKTKLDFTEEEKKEFATNPAAYHTFRKALEEDGNKVHYSTIRGSDMANAFSSVFRQLTEERLASRPDLLASFTPDFGVGCRRLTPGPGYLETLMQDNVDFVSGPIECINETGIRLQDGRQIDLDVLCCATGFDVTSIPPFPVTGRGGKTLAEKFTPYPKTYLTMVVDDMPNFFIMLGPNSTIGAGSLTILLEAEGDYIVKCVRKLQKEDYACMAVRAVRVREFADYVYRYFQRTVYMDPCKSWYKTGDGRGDRIRALWPGSILHAMEAMRAPRWEDFEFESLDDHGMRWLGNGWSQVLMDGGGDPSWYLNEGELDVPPEMAPETDPRYKARPFSH